QPAGYRVDAQPVRQPQRHTVGGAGREPVRGGRGGRSPPRPVRPSQPATVEAGRRRRQHAVVRHPRRERQPHPDRRTRHAVPDPLMPKTMRPTPPVADHRVGIVISVLLFVVWAWFTWSQFDRTGKKPPALLRWATFWWTRTPRGVSSTNQAPAEPAGRNDHQ